MSQTNETNFMKVFDFNKKFGVKMHNKPDPSVFTEDKKLVELRMNLIREEMRELEDAVKNHDLVETIDALGDILYVVYGMGVSLGINLDEAFRLVHDSNMSKLCVSEKEAEDTVAWYIAEFENGNLPYDSPAYRLSEDGSKWVIYNKSTGKILKSINYKIVDLKPVVSQNVTY